MNPRVEAKPSNFPPAEEGSAAAAAPTPGSGGEVAWITLVCRAVSLQDVVADANITIAYTLENQLKACPLLDPARSGLVGNITQEEGTFSFNAQVLLKHALKL